MKRILFTVTLALAAMAVNAQDRQTATISTPTYLEAPMYCVSANGKYAAGDFGAVCLLDIETGEQIVFYDAANEACTAKGVTDDGTIVGQFGADLSAPGAVLKKGASAWTILPVPDGFNDQYEFCPQGVTSDGKYIVGNGYDLGKGMYAPLIWTLQDDGSYTVDVLPYPDEDIWGSLPQMATCYGVSNDGTRAYGKIVDFTGYTTLGIIYKKADDGTWSYQTVGEDWLIKDVTANPGPQPQFEDYVTAEVGTDEYWVQASEFDFLVLDWWGEAEKYAKLNQNPANQIIVNQNSMSGNGKYFVMSTPDDARIYNVEDGTFTSIGNSPGIFACTVTNDGDVVLASYISSPMRTAYYCPNGEYESGLTTLLSWLDANYDVKYAEGTEEGFDTGVGTCCVTPDGKTFVGFNFPMQQNMYYISSIIRIGETATGVSNIKLAEEPVIENGRLYIPEGEAQVSVYDATGCQVAAFSAAGSADLTAYAKGLAIVRVQSGKLLKTFKVTL